MSETSQSVEEISEDLLREVTIQLQDHCIQINPKWAYPILRTAFAKLTAALAPLQAKNDRLEKLVKVLQVWGCAGKQYTHVDNVAKLQAELGQAKCDYGIAQTMRRNAEKREDSLKARLATAEAALKQIREARISDWKAYGEHCIELPDGDVVTCWNEDGRDTLIATHNATIRALQQWPDILKTQMGYDSPEDVCRELRDRQAELEQAKARLATAEAALEEYRNPDHWILENAEWRFVPWPNMPNPSHSPQDIANRVLDAAAKQP